MKDALAVQQSGQVQSQPGARDFLLRSIFSSLITVAQVAADFVTVFLVFLVSYWFYTRELDRVSPQSFSAFFIFSLIASGIYIPILDRVGLYQREMSLLNIRELRGIFRTGIYAAALILSISFYFRSVSFSRITLTLALGLAPVMLFVQRQIFYKLHVLFHLKGWSQNRVLIYGAGHIGTHVAKRFFESPALGFFPVGFADDDPTKKDSSIKWRGIGPKSGVRVLGGEEVLRDLTKDEVDMVVIALPSATFERNRKIVGLCIERGIEYAIVPNFYEKFIETVEVMEIGGIPVLRKRRNDTSVYYLMIKRIIDFVIAAALLLALSPLYLLLGAWIKIDSKGPVVFKQKRVGLRGRQFSLYKFRSMFIEAPKYAHTPTDPADPRITRAGRWLRRTSLDELPQLFNVLRGDMSLVGPRPEMPFIVEKYTTLERLRLDAKPGITGVWQISAVRGEPIHANLEYDLFYLEHRSTLLDLAIVVKTAISVIRGVGAV